MDRFAKIKGFLFFTLLAAGDVSASIIVTNDWATAAVQLRDQKGGVVSNSKTVQGGVGFDISEIGLRGDFSHVEINQDLDPGSFITARVVTDDAYTEVEAWLDTSWSFVVRDEAVDFQIGLFVDVGGAFTSNFSLYDLTIGSLVISDELISYGYIGGGGTLLAEHSYVFNASLPRVDADDLSDLVYDGTSGLDFRASTDVFFSPDRTHLRIDVPEPSPLVCLLMGLSVLGGLRGWMRLQLKSRSLKFVENTD